jgi:predicted NBD/HSP70 family sugar kinase
MMQVARFGLGMGKAESMRDGSERPESLAEGAATRRAGRPRTLDAGGASLSTVLNLVRTGKATTRLDIERESELGRAVVADRLSLLAKLGLVEDGDLGPAIGGRAPRHARFVSDAGTLLVAVVERSSLAVALADLTGALQVEHHEAADLSAGPEAVLERLTTLFVWLLDERGGKAKVWGIGVALPEPVLVDSNDSDAFGIGTLDILRAWRRFDFAAELALRFGAPCSVRGSAQTMTIGELEGDSGQAAADMLFLKLDRSISAGVTSAGRLHRGALGLAGMIGHAPTGETSEIVCHCGARGCLEALASGDAVAREGAAAAQEGRSRYLADMLALQNEVTADDVAHGAQLGDAFCTELLSRCGRLVGQNLAPLVNLLNPAILVLGGALAQSGDTLLAAVREAIYRQSHPLVTRDLRIVRSRMGNSAGLVGAARVVADEMFAPAMLREWIGLGSPRKRVAFLDFLETTKARKRKAAREPAPPVVVAPPNLR